MYERIEDMRGLKNLKTKQIFSKKPKKICSTVKATIGLTKQPKEQELAQDDTTPVLLCYYGLFNEVWRVVDALQSNQLDIIRPRGPTLVEISYTPPEITGWKSEIKH